MADGIDISREDAEKQICQLNRQKLLERSMIGK